MSDCGEHYDFDDDDYRTVWNLHFGRVIVFALNDFIGRGVYCRFDFESAPKLNSFPPELVEFHARLIQPIAALIMPPQADQPELTMIQRFEIISPHIRAIITQLYGLEVMEFMREEIQSDLEAMIVWHEGNANGASFNECFHGTKGSIVNPRTCSASARRA